MSGKSNWLFSLGMVLALFLAVFSPGPASSAPSSAPIALRAPEVRPGVVLVKFKSGTALAKEREVKEREQMAELERIEGLDVLVMSVPSGREIEKAEALRQDTDVLYAEPDYIVHAVVGPPNDPYFMYQWGPKMINVTGAWDYTYGQGVTVAIVDTGVLTTHPDLQANIVAGYDFVNKDADPTDDHGHGTHVAGIVAAVANNGIGVAGVAPSAKIMPVKVLDSNGSGYDSDVIAGMRYAADNGAKVVNISLGQDSPSAALADAVNYVVGKGVVVVAAAGNDGTNAMFYPAGYVNAVAVGATDSSDLRGYFSNYGGWVDVAAPGVSIYSTVLPRPPDYAQYTYMSGTSMATPHAAGLAALLFSRNPAATVTQVRQAMETTGVELPNTDWGRSTPLRRLDALAAVLALPAPNPPRLDVSRNASLFLSDTASDPPAQTIEVCNRGGSTLSWSATISASASWLTVTPASGNAPSTFTLNAARPTPATPGTYTATVTVSGSGQTQDSPQIIQVTYVVAATLQTASVGGVYKQ